MANLGTYKFTRKSDGMVFQVDLDAALQKMVDGALRGSGAGTSWFNAYWGLPVDIGTTPRADNAFASGINYEGFAEQDQAKAALQEYLKLASQIVNKSWQLFDQAKSQYGSWNNMDARNQYAQGMQQFVHSDFQTALNDAQISLEKKVEAIQSSYEPAGVNQQQQQTSAGSTADTGGQSGTFNTYQSAKQNGFQGTFSDWVNAGRPSGGGGAQPPSYSPPTPAPATTGAGTTSGGTSPTTPAAPTAPIDNTAEALKVLESSSNFQDLPENIKTMLRITVKNWDPTKEVNMENVLAEFDKIKNETIDPQFAERVQVFSDDVRTAYANLAASRASELEAERFTAGQNIKQARAGLEQAGMTFTGLAIEQLGADSAFSQYGTANAETMSRDALINAIALRENLGQNDKEALADLSTEQLRGRIRNFIGEIVPHQPLTQQQYNERYGTSALPYNQYLANWQANENSYYGTVASGAPRTTTASGMPTQIPYGGLFYEGSVNQANRLIATSSAQRYLENLRTVGRQAESALGGLPAASLVPGYTSAGTTTGSIEADRQAALAATLSALGGQQDALTQYSQPIDFTKYNSVFQ